MLKPFYTSISLFLFCLLFSCKHKRGVIIVSNPIEIDILNEKKHISLIDNIDSLRILKLETIPKSLLSGGWSIQRIIYLEDKFIILDGKFMVIKVFDKNGKYLYDFGELGNNHGQFIRIEDIQYNEFNNTIMVLCNNPRKIIEFNLKGTVLKESSIYFFATSFVIQSPNSFIFYINKNHSPLSARKELLKTDSTFNVIWTLIDSDTSINTTIKFSGGLFKVNNQIWFSQALKETYYLIQGDSIIPKFKINYRNKKLPENFKEEELFQEIDKYGFQYNTFFYNSDYIGFNFFNKEIYSAFYNLKNELIIMSDPKKDSLNFLFNNLFFQNGSQIICVIEPDRYKDFLVRNEKLINNRFPTLKPLFSELDTKRNPTLLLFKLATK